MTDTYDNSSLRSEASQFSSQSQSIAAALKRLNARYFTEYMDMLRRSHQTAIFGQY